MNVLTPGYLYELAFFKNKERPGQQLQFIENDVAMNLIHDGTTNEEVLAMLIDRLRFLGARLPSRETSIAITKCEEALQWLNARTRDRETRGVEGTSKP